MAPLHRRFQMDRLVRFNEKFSPDWRPRYLVYESRPALPRAIVRVLQAEGYLAEPPSSQPAGGVAAPAAGRCRRVRGPEGRSASRGEAVRSSSPGGAGH